MGEAYIRWFHEIDRGSIHLVGGKGANLGEMARAGMPVPPGFCVTSQAYYDFLTITDLVEAIVEVLGGARGGDYRDVDETALKVQKLILDEQIPYPIGDSLIESYHNLGALMGMDAGAIVAVAVRSSATAEDLPDASFAGQQDTYLNILGDSEVLRHVKECWASLWTPRAITYRQKQGFDHLLVRAAVVVQSMLDSDTSGVLFTANPISGDFSEAVLNASWGLGEAVVSGLVNPDTYVIRKEDGVILSRQAGTKEIAIVNDGEGGTRTVEIPPIRREVFALSDDQVAELVNIGTKIEAHYGHPHDVEWAYVDDKCFILQARPITTLPSIAPDEGPTLEYNRTMFVELLPEPLCPLFLSVLAHLIGDMLDFVLRMWGFKPPDDLEPVGVFYNQPYFNRQYIETAVAPLPERVRVRLIGQIINPFGHQERELEGGSSLAYIGFLLRMLRVMYHFPERIRSEIAAYRANIAEVQTLPIEMASDAELVSRIRDKVFGAGSRLLSFDFLLIAVTGISYQVLGSILAPYFGKDMDFLRARLISGLDGNLTMETNMRLWDLAQTAKEDPEVNEFLLQTNPADARDMVRSRFPKTRFEEELNSFIQEYGHREIRMDILFPTWVEDPAPVMGFIRGYLEADVSLDPHLRHEELGKDRQRAVDEVRAALSESRVGKWVVFPIFMRALSYSQALTRERDTMHFEITRLFPLFRQYLLEIGRRWKRAGRIGEVEDVFFLRFKELEEMCVEPRSVEQLVSERRAELEAAKARRLPDVIIGGKEYYLAAEEETVGSGDEIRGIAGSPGVVSGVARLVRSADDFDKLGEGDILVAPFTTPVWTPLFAIAAGVITETGGILSHGAIVAREYGIPAVMSVAGATSILKDGDRIEVDGDAGIVHVS